MFFLGPYGTRPPLFLLLDLSVKWYDNDDSKGVQFLQGKFHFFHPVATILSYLTKAPLVIKRLFGPHQANFKVMQSLFPLWKMLSLLLVIAVVLFTFGSSEGLGRNVAGGRF